MRDLNPRKLVGASALGLLLLLGLSSNHITGLSKDDWGTWWKLAFVVALCLAFFATFFDRKNLPEKTWDYNPKRGLLYFFLGWIIFPVMIGIEAISGTDFSLGGVDKFGRGIGAGTSHLEKMAVPLHRTDYFRGR